MPSSQRKAPLRTAVVGYGHFGRYHAQKIAASEHAELVAVADRDPGRADAASREHGVMAVTDHRRLLGQVEAACIVVPTAAHVSVARDFLEAGVDVLVEKPIAGSVAEAEALVALARERNRILQVGHLERFTDMARVLREQIDAPLFIESVRIAPFQPRGTDVSVTLDLMIHDLDLALTLVDAPIVSVEAAGAPVFSDNDDIVSARIKFADGCIASLTASRISLKTERRMRIFQADAYIAIDFDNRRIRTVKRPEGNRPPDISNIEMLEQDYQDGDPLGREIESFFAAVREHKRPAVSGEDGLEALRAALLVTDSLRAHAAFVHRARGGAAIQHERG